MLSEYSQANEVVSYGSAEPARRPFAGVMLSISKEEYIRLKWEADYWKTRHERAIAREVELKAEIEELQAQVRDLQQRMFGRRSEKSSAGNESQSKPARCLPRGQRPNCRGHGRTCNTQLPAQEEVVELGAAEQQCPSCRLPLVCFPGTEDSEVVEVEVKAYRRVIHRQRYRPSCQCGRLPGIVTAPAPARLIAKGKIGLSVWVEVLLDKYLYSRATNRLLKSWESLGLKVSQGTIIGGLKRIGPLFDPVLGALRERQLSDGCCHGDETGWRVFEPVEGKVGYRWYLWVICSKSALIFQLAPSRAAAVPLAHFAKLLVQTILICDRYSAYKKAARIIGIMLAFCWAHVRRDFLDLGRGYPQLEPWARQWVERIGTLYHLNNCRLEAQADPVCFAQHQETLQAHLQQMLVERDQGLADPQLHRAARKVLQSLKVHWAGLTVFVDHLEIPMDNNIAERVLRNEVIGRKCYYGSGSVWAAELAAKLFSILMSLVHCWGINPRLWLHEYLQACADIGQRPPQDLSAFLPWVMDAARLHYLRGPAQTTQWANSS